MFGTFTLLGQLSNGKAPLSALDQFSNSVQAVSARVAPAVVQIEATRYGQHEESLEGRVTVVVGKEQSIGSGVITSSDGYILTNAHVVSGAERIRVTLLSTESAAEKPDSVITGALAQPFARSLEAKIVGVFQEMDIALIKVGTTGLSVLIRLFTRNRVGARESDSQSQALFWIT